MAKTRSKSKESHSHLALRVKSYSASTNASVYLPVATPTFVDENRSAYSFGTDLELIAFAHWPEERAEEEFWLTIYSLQLNDRRLRLALKDFHKVNEKGELQYRKYRGDDYPIYDLPRQIGFLQKNRHYGVWTGAAWVSPNVVSDMLALLLHREPLYIALHEIRVERRRAIFGMSLQTNDPAEE